MTSLWAITLYRRRGEVVCYREAPSGDGYRHLLAKALVRRHLYGFTVKEVEPEPRRRYQGAGMMP